MIRLRSIGRRARAAATVVDRLRFRLAAPRRHGVRCTERVGALVLTVPASVLNPVLFRTGPFLGEAVAARCRAGVTVLDVGCGSGVVGLRAAAAGAEVVAIDVNPDAVIATADNAADNRLEIDARLGDLFAALDPDRRFDIIAFNPPFLERQEATGVGLERALYDGPGLPVLTRFLEGARGHLADGGAVLIVGSTAGALGRMRQAYAANGWRWHTIARRERLAERLVVDELA